MIALIILALNILFFLVLGQIVVSWIPPGGEFLESVRRLLAVSTEWLLWPLRRTIPPLRLGAVALDLSPLIVLIGIQILISVLVRLA